MQTLHDVPKACVCAFILLSSQARAGETYEDQQLQSVLTAESLQSVSPKRGEAIAFIRIVRREVFTPDDPFPDFLNVAHVVTKEEVVARELLFAVGDPFNALTAKRIDESARILRNLFILAMVRVVPVRDADGAVGVLVFTRDLWSLRVEQFFQVTGLQVDRLLIEVAERNLFGHEKVASIRFRKEPAVFALGQRYADRRIWGSRIGFWERTDVFFGVASKRPEGVVGAVTFGRPLVTLGQTVGFSSNVSYDVGIRRQLQGAQTLLFDDPATVQNDRIERLWDQRNVRSTASSSLQLGSGMFRHRFFAGVGAASLRAKPSSLSQLAPGQAERFTQMVLPLNRTEIYPFARYHVFSTSYESFTNLDAQGISEVRRTGPTFMLELSGGAKALLSSTNFMQLKAGLGIVSTPLGTLLETSVEVNGRVEDGALVDEQLNLWMRLATAPVFWSRLFLRLDSELRKNDTQKTLVSLGGHNGLRGYPSQAFVDYGASLVRANVELRTLPLVWRSLHIGLAVFYDAGTLFTRLENIEVKHSVGFGIRFMSPQVNKIPYRLDVAVPVGGDGFQVLFSFGDTQMVEHARPASLRLDPSNTVPTTIGSAEVN